MQAITALLRDFYLATDLRVALYDKGLRCIASEGPTAYSFCNAVHATREGLSCCFASDRDAFARVAKTKKPYAYTCPFGVFEAILPVMSEGVLIAYLFVGEAAAADAPATHHARAALPFAAPVASEAELVALFEAFPHYSPARLQAFTALAALVAERLAATLPVTQGTGSIAEEIKRYIARSYHKRITLAELALHFHCSTVTLTESFKKAFGSTIMAHTLAVRMAAAEELLLGSDLPVATVATRCGFESVAHFSKVFKRAHGTSPLHWRQQNRG